ncbi:MAG: LemA family protein [Asticcacaulis sp.]
MTALSKRMVLTAAVMVSAASLAGCGVNDIPTREERAKTAFSEVQNQYQRRADLTPNLVATVQGAAAQERNVLVEVTEARAKATSVTVDGSTITDPEKFRQFQQAQDGLSSALGRLMVVVEKYPDLKTNQNFLTLQSQLEGTENRIAIARRDYNEAVNDYNLSLRTFPSIIWAKTIHGGSKPMERFEASAGAQNAPKVDFGPAAPAVAPNAAPAAAPAAEPAKAN